MTVSSIDQHHAEAPTFRTLVDEDGQDLFPFSAIMSKHMIAVARDVMSRMPVEGAPELPEIFLEVRTDHPRTIVPPCITGPQVVLLVNATYSDLWVDEDGMSIRLLFDACGGSSDGDIVYIPWKALASISCPDHEFRLELVPQYD